MDFSHGEISSGDEASSNTRNGENHHMRHSAEQIQRLEEFFRGCPNPTEEQREQLGKDLDLVPRQIRFWFQNKRNHMKIQNDRARNNALREENARIFLENLAIKEMLNNPLCPKCKGSAIGDDVEQQTLERLRIENALLKQEYHRLANIVATLRGKPAGVL